MQRAGKRVAKNSFSQAITYIARAASSFFITVLIARLAGADKLGVYSFSTTFTAAAFFLTDLGVSVLLIRAIARNRDAVHKYINNSFSISVILSPIFFLITAAVVMLLRYPPEIIYAVYLSALGLVFFGFTTLFKGAFFAYERMELETITTVVQETVYLIGGLIVLFLDLPFLWVFAVFALSRFLGLIMSWLSYEKYMAKLRLEFDYAFCKALLIEALPFAANVLFTLIHARAAIFVLSHVQGLVPTGHYEAAFNISIRLSIIAQLFNNSLLPIMSREHGKPDSKFLSYTALSMKYLLIVGLPLSIGLFLLADKVVGLIYGAAFLPAVLVFQITVAITAFKFVGLTLATALTASNQQGKRTLAVGIVAMLNLMLNIFLVPSYSAVGAAIAAAISETTLCILFFFFVHRHIGNYAVSLENVWKPLLGSIIMGGIIVVMSGFSLVAILPVATITYGAILLIVRVFSPEELTSIKRIGGKIRLPAARS